MTDVKIIVDTGADMPPELIEEYDIGILPFLSIFGEETYVTGVDITNEEFFDKLEASEKFPTTSQTPYADMYDYLKEQVQKHDSVIYFTLSSKGSGQFQTATLISRELMEENPEFDIRIVDSMKYSVYISLHAIIAVQMAREGRSVDEIVEYFVSHITNWRCYLLVDTLKYLEKGGRLSKTKAFVGTLLDVKPILAIEHGLVESFGNLRGKKKLVEKLIDKIGEDEDFDSDNPEFLVVQSDDERGQRAVELLKEEYGDDCIKMYAQFGPVVGTHVGRGAFAVLFKLKN